jgi:hypothetical protein
MVFHWKSPFLFWKFGLYILEVYQIGDKSQAKRSQGSNEQKDT